MSSSGNAMARPKPATYIPDSGTSRYIWKSVRPKRELGTRKPFEIAFTARGPLWRIAGERLDRAFERDALQLQRVFRRVVFLMDQHAHACAYGESLRVARELRGADEKGRAIRIHQERQQPGVGGPVGRQRQRQTEHPLFGEQGAKITDR